jgi:hypothetical protein
MEKQFNDLSESRQQQLMAFDRLLDHYGRASGTMSLGPKTNDGKSAAPDDRRNLRIIRCDYRK